jgi:tetratricopeptide (TPR) repeat protein
MIAFAACAGLLLQNAKPAWAVVVIAVLASVSAERTAEWKTEKSLWTDAANKAPAKIRPKIQLARSVPPADAIAILESARKMAPEDDRIPSEEGRIYLSAGKPLQALEQFGRALALAPGSADAFNNRGAALLALRQNEAARNDFERALHIEPCAFDARLNLLRMGVEAPRSAACHFNADQRAALGWN